MLFPSWREKPNPGGGLLAHRQVIQILRLAIIPWIVCTGLAGSVGAQCTDTLTNHDGSMDNAYSWIYQGGETSTQGAFAECYAGDFTICEIRIHLSQVGNSSGATPNQTMDIFVWQDDGIGNPGAVISQLLDVAPGTIAQWPLFSRHDITLSVPVSGNWWVGVRRNEAVNNAAWLLAADESSSLGCSRTHIGPGQGYPVGWQSTSQVSFMSNCSSFGVQVVGTLPDIEDPVSCGTVLANHDLTWEHAYSWIPSGSETGEQGAFAECFSVDDGSYIQACGLQFYLTQIGNQTNQTMDIYVWRDSPIAQPGELILHLENVDPGPVATWPEVSRFDIPVDVSLPQEWWVGWRGNWAGDSPGWMIAADENGPGGCSVTNVGPGHGYPVGWSHPGVVPAWAQCQSLGIRTVGNISPVTIVNYFWINNDDTYTNNQIVTLSMDVPGAVDMQFSNDGSTWSGWVPYAATYENWDMGSGEGTKTVYAHFRELPSYRVTDAQDDIILDTTPPSGVTDLTADRGQEKVTLSWTNPDDGETALEVWRAVWHNGDDITSAYPEYDVLNGYVIPTIPADHAAALLDDAWQLVYTVIPSVNSQIDLLANRGIYYYAVYPEYDAGLFGDCDDASSISYLLGDVAAPYDGVVTGSDITDLALAFGTSHAGGGTYNNECDVGPTDDYSGAGIPNTDDLVNFEDLMIFALNWDEVLTKTQPNEGSMTAMFSWVRNDDETLSLVLNEPCANLKGVNLQANLVQGSVLSLTAGTLLRQQENPYFLQNIPSNGLDAGIALLGGSDCITGRGELIRITLAEEIEPEDILIVARNGANEDLDYILEEATDAPDIPTSYAILANYPNPFNPSTKIDFALPEPQSVKLVIYAVDGRQVATLMNESLPAGHHTVTWLGRDDKGKLVASGTYFYRIQAGDFNRTQKMTLLK